MRIIYSRILAIAALVFVSLVTPSQQGIAFARPQELESDERDKITAFAQRYAMAWSSQNPENVASFYSDDGRLVVNNGEAAVGREAIADVARGFMDAFPDMVVSFDRLERRGERVLFHWTLTGTNTGPGGTGASVRISGFEAWLVDEGGLIADSDGTFDADDYARQLAAGSVPVALRTVQQEVWQGEIDYWDRVNSRDIPAVTALMADDVEWNEAEGNKLADRSPYIGPQAVVEGVFQRLAEDFETFEVDIDTIISEGDLVVTAGRYRGTGRENGVSINPRIASFWTVKDGKITAFQQHVDTLILAKAVGGPA